LLTWAAPNPTAAEKLVVEACYFHRVKIVSR